MNYDAVAITDTGEIRAANEDDYFTGASVFAVADGMGGHVAGEVASRTALGPVAELDGRVFGQPVDAVAALLTAVDGANAAVNALADEDPELRGMGTTLTAALIEGRRLHLAHVGDSRAYLVRDGEIRQLTTDHTLVQHLLDSGEITEDQVATHPQRSIITRAIGVSPTIQIDIDTVELVDGDRVVLCSDGLTGLVRDDEIRDTLLANDAEAALDALVALANQRGGPDNITVVVVRVEPGRSAPGSGGRGPALIRTGDGDTVDGEDWAGKLGRFGALARGGAGRDDGRRGPTRRQRIVAGAVVAGLLLSLAYLGGRWLVSRSYYVGLDEGQVVIYRGVPTNLGPIGLSWVEERTDLDVTILPEFYRRDLEEGIAAADLNDARLIVENAPRRAPAPAATPSPSPRATPSPSASPAATPTATPAAGPGPSSTATTTP